MSLNNQLKSKLKDIKIVVAGNCGTGKTSFCHKWVKNVYSEKYKATIISEFSYKVHEYNGNFYKVQLWDLAGQDRNINVTKILTKNAHGCIIFSDITNEKSLKETLKWKNAIDKESFFVDGHPLPCLLIQNKIDLINKEQLACETKLSDFAKNNNFIYAIRTSVKEDIGIDEAINCIIQNIVQRLDNYNYAKLTCVTVIDDGRKSDFSSLRDKASFINPEEKSRCC